MVGCWFVVDSWLLNGCSMAGSWLINGWPNSACQSASQTSSTFPIGVHSWVPVVGAMVEGANAV